MSSRREERERLRARRLAEQSKGAASGRRRLVAGYLLAGLLTLAVLGGLVVAVAGGGDDGVGSADVCENAGINPNFGRFESLEPDCREGADLSPLEQGDLQIAARRAGCTLRQNLPNEGQTHVDNSTEVEYGTNPPTSGNHHPEPVADGAYLTPLRVDPAAAGTDLNVRNFVHTLEHGRIEVQYSPNLPEEDQLALKGLFDEDPTGMLLFPNPSMPWRVAATAWGQLLGCPEHSPEVIDAIRDFRDTYRGQGPENVGMSAPPV